MPVPVTAVPTVGSEISRTGAASPAAPGAKTTMWRDAELTYSAPESCVIRVILTGHEIIGHLRIDG